MAALLAAQGQDVLPPKEPQPPQPPMAPQPPEAQHQTKGLARQPRAEAGGVVEDLDKLAEATRRLPRSRLTETLASEVSGNPKNAEATAAPSFYSVGAAALLVAKSRRVSDGPTGNAEPQPPSPLARRVPVLARGKTAKLPQDMAEASRPARPALAHGRTVTLAADEKNAATTGPKTSGDSMISVAMAAHVVAARRKKLQRSRFTRAFGRQATRPIMASPPPQSEEKRGSEMPQDIDAATEINPWSGLNFRGKVTNWLQKMALEMKIPVDILKQAYDVFSEHAQILTRRRSSLGELTEAQVAEKAVLSHDALATILCKLTNVESPEELPEGLLTSCFLTPDSSKSRLLNFVEFAVWFSRYGFNENVLLSEEQREIRKLARRHGLPITTVEKYKNQFDAFDLDRSEKIEFDEFEKLLYVLLRIPKDLDLPQSRVRQFWLEAGPDAEGALGFEEFLVFYSRHFSLTDNLCPVQEFYRGLRRVHVRSMRPHS